jgi:tripartite-type tricarboxylate transporter receptor subunit TctC
MKTQKSRGARAALALGVVSLFALGACSAATDSEVVAETSGEEAVLEGGFSPADEELVFVDGVLQPLSDGFPSGSVTLVVVDEAGSDDGIYARALAEAAGNISPVDIIIEDRPEFGSTYGAWEAIDWASDQRGGDEGYWSIIVTLPGSTIDLLQTPVAADLGVSMESLNTVMLTESVPYILVTRAGAPWGSDFAAMLEYAKANPGEVKYLSRGPGAGPDLAMNTYASAAGVEFNASVGGSHSEILTALGAGAGDVAVTLPGAGSPFIQDGTVELMTCSGAANPCAANWGTEKANASSILGIDSDPWGSGRGVVTVEGIPESHRLWLEALVDAASSEESFISARSSIPGVGLAKLNKEGALALQKTAYRLAYEVLEGLGQLSEGVAPPS